MPSARWTRAQFTGAAPFHSAASVGVVLCFRPERSPDEPIEDRAELGPELTIPAVGGLGKVLRILRAARVAAPGDPLELVGREARAAELLARAAGTRLRLALRRRGALRFVAWTEQGVESVGDVAGVLEEGDEIVVLRSGGRLPVRFPRERVVRRTTELETWYEVLDIERG
jgi:hypothetical protein